MDATPAAPIRGDGTIWVISLTELTVLGKIEVGGTPTSLIAIGGELHQH